MKSTAKIICFAILFSGVPVLVRISEEWHDVGSAKLMDYTRGDYMILGISCLAYFGSNLISFVSTKWADYKKEAAVEKAAVTDPAILARKKAIADAAEPPLAKPANPPQGGNA